MNTDYFTRVSNALTQAEAGFRDRFWGPKIPRHDFPSPNILTIIRIIGSVILLLLPLEKNVFIIATIFLFLTDYFDGIIARTQNKETTFGKWADHMADRMLVVGVVYFLYHQNSIWLHYFIKILVPESLTLLIWAILLIQGKSARLQPNGWGRTKFGIYFFALLFGLFNMHSFGGFLVNVGLVCAYLGLLLDVRPVFTKTKSQVV